MTFDTFFRLSKQFTEYCERIGEDFLIILIRITHINDINNETKNKLKIYENWAEDPSIIATHIAIKRPFSIFGGFIDKRNTVVITENINKIEFNTTVDN